MMGAWPCARCGKYIFSYNFFVHDCTPPAPTLDWDDEPEVAPPTPPTLEWDDDPREGSLAREAGGDEGSTPKAQEPGPQDAPNRS